MTAPLRDRLAKILASARPSIDFPAWGPMERDRDHWREIADALLASEEWQAREAVVEAAENGHHPFAACTPCQTPTPGHDPCPLCAALARDGVRRGRGEGGGEMKKWKPQKAEFFGWEAFLAWAKANGVDTSTKDDGEAWWLCWKAGFVAGVNN